MGQVEHPCSYWIVDVPPLDSMMERVGQINIRQTILYQ